MKYSFVPVLAITVFWEILQHNWWRSDGAFGEVGHLGN